MEFIFSECVMHNENIYAYEVTQGMMVMISPSNGEAKYLELPCDFKIQRNDAIVWLQSIEGKIFAVENSGENIFIYDTVNKLVNYLPINIGKEDWGNTIFSTIYDEHFYVFPKYLDEFIKVNIYSYDICRFKYQKSNNTLRCGIRIDNIVYLFDNYECVVKINLIDNSTQMVAAKINKKQSGLASVVKTYDNNILGLDTSGIIYSIYINEAAIEFREMCNISIGMEDDKIALIDTTDKIIGLPLTSGKIVIYDKRSTQKIECKNYPSDFEFSEKYSWSQYKGYCEDVDNIYVAMRSANYILKIDKHLGNINFLKPKIDRYWLVKNKINCGTQIICEEECSIETFIHWITKL